ncbi:autotransporter-associated beta strand repeat-containing protein [Bordetella genomosp. 9]|nr:autotransporter-associated beta strand repeat-containing protein [Bordetella genomosp. 9]
MPLLAMPLLMLDAAAPAEAGRDGERRRFILKSRLDVPVQQPGGQMTISYDMSGPGSLRKSGPGLLRLTGANTYTGGTIVERGILRIGDGYAQGSVAGHILNHDLVEFDHDADTVFDGRISGNGGVYFIGAGKTTLTADQHYTGPTAIGDGALQLGNGGVAGSVAGPVHNHNTLIFNRRDAVQMRAGIHGPGRIVHAGSGTTVLLAANTYSGMTDVRRGTLIVNGDQHAATGAVVVRKGAALGGEGTLGGPVRIDDGGALLAPDATRTLSMPSLTLSPGATVRLPVTDGDAHDGAESPPRIDVDGDVVLDGALDIAGQDAAAYRRGIHRLMRYRGQLTDRTMEIRAVPAGTRAYDWSIRTSRSGRIDVVHTAAGPLLIWEGRDPQADGAGGWTDGAYAVFDGQPGTVEIASRDAPVTFSGAQFATDGYRLTGPGVLKATAALTPLRVGDGVSGSETMRATIEAAIEGAAILMKTGRGTLQLGGANRHTGGVLLQEGILEIGDDRNLGAPRAPLTFAGGALRTTGDVDSGRPIRLGAQGGLIDTGGRIVRWRGTADRRWRVDEDGSRHT